MAQKQKEEEGEMLKPMTLKANAGPPACIAMACHAVCAHHSCYRKEKRKREAAAVNDPTSQQGTYTRRAMLQYMLTASSLMHRASALMHGASWLTNGVITGRERKGKHGSASNPRSRLKALHQGYHAVLCHAAPCHACCV